VSGIPTSTNPALATTAIERRINVLFM
jgi:hypothetical protein